MRQISWEMSQCCLLLRGLVTFAARVTVSDTSCHFQRSLLVPESAPNIPPQEMSLHKLMKERKTFQKQFKAQHLGEKKKQPCNDSLLRSVLDLILTQPGWQKSPISSLCTVIHVLGMNFLLLGGLRLSL